MRTKEEIRIYNQEYRLKNRDKMMEYDRQYNINNRARKAEYGKQYNIDNNEKRKNNLIARRYGLTLEEFNSMLNAQSGLCAICKKEKATHIDHDHLSGQVRGILCHKCNTGLGMFNDDLNLIGRDGRAGFYLRIR